MKTAFPSIDRARAYVAAIPGAVSGAGGHDQTFSVVCSLVRFGLQNGFGAVCRQLAVRLGNGVARLTHELQRLFVRQLALPRQGGGALDIDADRACDFGVLRAGATEAAEAFRVVKSAEPVRPARLLVDARHIA